MVSEGPRGAKCTCSRIQVGNRPAMDDGPRHWHPACPMHGEQSAWYRSPEQTHRRADAREQALKASPCGGRIQPKGGDANGSC